MVHLAKTIFLYCLPFLLIAGPLGAVNAHACTSYQVVFKGVNDACTLTLLKSSSQLVALCDTPAATEGAFKRRVKDDVPNLLKALQSLAYYEAKVVAEIDHTNGQTSVLLNVDTGPVYPFAAFEIRPKPLESQQPPCFSCTLDDLDVALNTPAYPKTILDAQDALIKLLERQGYPLAKVEKREVFADQTAKTVSVVLHVDTGPLTTFGPTTVTGQHSIKDLFFKHKIAWHEGCRYDPDYVERTINALETSGLFSSITIDHAEEALDDGALPMEIAVVEAKHRSVGFGFSYSTDWGPGAHGEWENRNIRGLGEKLSCTADIWQRKKQGSLRYIKPDFCRTKQDLIWAAELEHEVTEGFVESSFSASGTIERQLNDDLRISYGGMYKRLFNSHSDNNGEFNLLKMPLQLFWHHTDNLLDPTIGGTLHLKSTPSLEIKAPRFAYAINTMAITAYQPLDADHRFVLAGKATLGSIWGAGKRTIPPSERFYAGSDNLLRGYKYLTVSPLNCDNKPLGGRSMMVYSLEARMRLMECFGLVAFYDIGNVYSSPFPQFKHEQRQSLGLGLRYHTPVGPLRVDVAFPLNPRRHIDHACEMYFSIGQSF